MSGGRAGDAPTAPAVAALRDATRRMDVAAIERLLDEAFAARALRGGDEQRRLSRRSAPSARTGRPARSTSRMEHAASETIRRRLARFYDAAVDLSSPLDVIVGLPPGCQHEIGAMGFAVAARRRGLSVLYLGANVPVPSWVRTVGRPRPAVAVVGAIGEDDVAAASDVVEALLASSNRPRSSSADGRRQASPPRPTSSRCRTGWMRPSTSSRSSCGRVPVGRDSDAGERQAAVRIRNRKAAPPITKPSESWASVGTREPVLIVPTGVGAPGQRKSQHAGSQLAVRRRAAAAGRAGLRPARGLRLADRAVHPDLRPAVRAVAAPAQPAWSQPAFSQPVFGAPQPPFAAPEPATPAKKARSSRRPAGAGMVVTAVLVTAVLASGGTAVALNAAGVGHVAATQPPFTPTAAGSGAQPSQAPANGAQPPVAGVQPTQPPATTGNGAQVPAPTVAPLAPGAQANVVEIVKAVSPAVVTIVADGVTETDPTTGQTGTGTATGSGVIFDASGLILTNHHVVAGNPSKLTVNLKDGRSFDATVYGIDTLTDLAIVKVDATGLPTAPIGDSSTIQVGQQAIAIGSPLGTFTDSVTSGIISAIGRSIPVETGTSSTT